MGGCCCCSSGRSQLNGAPVYYYCPQALEEQEPLSSSHGAASALSTELLVDTNLDTSTPDTYRAPPAPVPYAVDLGRPQTPPGAQDSSGNKIDSVVRTTDSESIGETVNDIAFESLSMCETLKESDRRIEDSVLPSPKLSEVEPSKPSEPIVLAMEEEDCPICLEEYDMENPRIVTKCEHHFHLSCILEWMERSDTCPVCDQEMILNHAIIE